MSESGPSKGKQKANVNGEDKGNGKKGAKQAPRKRVSQACDICRSRKDRCDGERPACSTCIHNDRVCSYNANVKKRGLPEGYVRGMEKLWGLAVKEVEDVEEDVLTALGDEEQQRSIWKDENSDNLVDIWRKSQIFTGLERLLSSMTVDSSETIKRKRVGSITKTSKKPGNKDVETAVTPHSEEEVKMDDMMDGILNTNQSATTISLMDNRPGSILAPAKTTSSTQSVHPPTSLSVPELPSETWHLLDVYFSYTHSWLPIVEKHDLLRISYQYSDRRQSTSNKGTGDHALLWAVIAYAKFQHRAINNIPRALGQVGDMVWTAERMYAQARALIPNEETPLDLGHVQALLILTLANLGMDNIERSWSLIGQAVRAVLVIHTKQKRSADQSLQPKSRNKHVFLGCFVLDTLVSARIGQKPHMRSVDIDSVGLLEEDGLEEWDPWTDCLNVRKSIIGNARVPAAILSTFNNLVKILQVLNDAICTGNIDAHASTELLAQLQTWTTKQESPSHWDIDNPDAIANIPLLPHHYHLYAVYTTTFSVSRLTSDHASPFAELAAKSAQNMAVILNQYSKNFGLLIATPTLEYCIKNAYDVLDLMRERLSDSQSRMDRWRKQLDYCMEMVEPAWPVMETLRARNTTDYGASRHGDHPLGTMNGKESGALPSVNDMRRNAQSYSTSSSSPTMTHTTQVRGSNLFSSHAQREAIPSNLSSAIGRPQNPLNMYQNAHATFGARNPPTPSQASSQDSLSVAVAQALATANNTQYNSRLRGSMSMGSDSDATGEPVFSDLMRLDATEW